MNMSELQQAVAQIQEDLEEAVRTARFSGKTYVNGQRAKEALIRSQRLILKIHEVTKVSLSLALTRKGVPHAVYPPIGQSSPELKVTGLIKAKQQDLVFLMKGDAPQPEQISTGPLAGETDTVGREVSERSIVIGVRSQLSSVAKNFDTLMERAFAETLNLRLRLPRLVMAEVYLLPIVEYDDVSMTKNIVAFKDGYTPVEKFIRVFLAISGRSNCGLDGSLYKYDRSCLLLVDLRRHPPTVFENLDQLRDEGVVSATFRSDFSKLSPLHFCEDLISAYEERHGV